MIRAALILSMVLLAACATPEPVERIVRVPVPVSPPAALLRCHGAPVKPTREYTQADVADLLLSYAEAHEDCQGKLGAVRRHVEQRTAE